MSESASEGMGYVHQLMDEHPGLLVIRKFVEFLGYDFNNVMRLLPQRRLHDPGEAVASGDNTPGTGALAPHADYSGFVQMGHSELLNNIPDSYPDVLSQFVMNHES